MITGNHLWFLTWTECALSVSHHTQPASTNKCQWPWPQTDKQSGVVVNKETPHWQEFPENRTQALKVTHKLCTTWVQKTLTETLSWPQKLPHWFKYTGKAVFRSHSSWEPQSSRYLPNPDRWPFLATGFNFICQDTANGPLCRGCPWDPLKLQREGKGKGQMDATSRKRWEKWWSHNNSFVTEPVLNSMKL